VGLILFLIKAYDLNEHELLLSKLESYGVQNTVQPWFKKYLFIWS